MQLSNRKDLAQLREEIEKALGPVAARHGLEFDLGNCRYSDNRCHYTKLQFNEAGKSEEAEAWERCAGFEGLGSAKVGDVFTKNGSQYRITGWRPRARKRPVLTTCTTRAGLIVWPAEVVRRALGIKDEDN